MRYERLPLTPEGGIKKRSIELLIQLVKDYSRGNIHIVFNCHMGIGRSTLAMALTTMLKMRQLAPEGEYLRHYVDPFPLERDDPDGLRPYYRAEYPSVMALLSVLDGGYECMLLLFHSSFYLFPHPFLSSSFLSFFSVSLFSFLFFFFCSEKFIYSSPILLPHSEKTS